MAQQLFGTVAARTFVGDEGESDDDVNVARAMVPASSTAAHSFISLLGLFSLLMFYVRFVLPLFEAFSFVYAAYFQSPMIR
jgi:hypothetical protein